MLDGVFQDEHGDYPTGSYVRNPPGSRHKPGSEQGCTIFVKLRQFAPKDPLSIVVDTNAAPLGPLPSRPGITGAIIHEDARENVRIENWAPDAQVDLAPFDGIEILCLAGDFQEGGEIFSRWSWLRLPVGARLIARAGADGCRLWLKEGHLGLATMVP